MQKEYQTLVELLDAESELSESRNLHIQSMINVQTSLVNVLQSQGNITHRLLTNNSEQLKTK
jgi:hypothetical protein